MMKVRAIFEFLFEMVNPVPSLDKGLGHDLFVFFPLQVNLVVTSA